MKKKAIKIAAASAVAASAFVAAAPLQSNAASNVTTTVDNAVKQMQVAYHTYSDVTANGQFADINSVYKELNAAKAAYTSATALVKKAGGAQKDANLAKLDDNYNTYITKRVVTYVDAYNYAVKNLVANKDALKVAIDAKNLVDVQKYYNEISYQLNKRTVILDRVYGQTTRDLLKSSYKADAQALKETMKYDVTVAVKVKAVTDAIAAGKLDVAKAAVDQINLNLPKVTETFKADLTTKATAAVAAYEATQTPAVVSVSAINGKELLVKFNKEVDASTASNINNYTFSDLNTVVASGAEVQEDGKSVVLTLTNAYDNTSAHSVAVTVQNVKVGGTVDTNFPIFTGVVSVNDTTKAEISGVTAVTNANSVTSFTVDFSEPVASGATFKVNGASVSSAVLNPGNKSATITVSSGLAVGSIHKIEAINLTDTAGNVNAVVSKEFTVTKDVNAPVVSSVEAKGDNQLVVTFSKNMKNDAAAQLVLASNIKVKNDVYADVAVSSITPVVNADGSNSKTQFVVQLVKTGALAPAVSASDLFSTTKTSHNLTVLFVDGQIQDYLGNTLAGNTKTATISKDNVAPEVTGVTYKKNSAGDVTDVVVSFSEGLAANGTLAFPTTMVDENGVVQSTTTVLPTIGTANVAAGAKTATFHLGTAKTVSGKYSVTFASAWVKDTSLVGNDSKSYQTVIDFGATQVSGEYTIPATSVTNSSTNQIQIVFPSAVKGGAVAGSATDASRYTINGKALPAGTTITLNAASNGVDGVAGTSDDVAAQTIATITLPTGTVDSSDTAAIFTINGVQTLTGKTNKAFTKALSITDNVKPVLQSARVLDNTHIELTYNEALKAGISSANVGEEFVISQGASVFTLADTNLLASNVGGYANKLVLTISKATGVTAPASVSAVSNTNATGATVAVSGTYSGTTNKTFKVRVASVDAATPKNVATWEISTDGGTTWSAPGTTTALGDGLTLGAFAAGSTDAVVGDVFTFTATAATTATPVTLDLTKDYTIKTVAPTTSTIDVKDAASNVHTADVVVTVAK